MTTKQVFEVSAEDFEKAIENKLSQIVKDSVLAKYDDRIVCASTVCEILAIHVTTLYRYIGAGMIKPIDHKEKAEYRFNLRMILEFDMNVKHKSIRTWKNSQDLSKNISRDTASRA